MVCVCESYALSAPGLSLQVYPNIDVFDSALGVWNRTVSLIQPLTDVACAGSDALSAVVLSGGT